MGIKASAQYTITEINEEYSVVISNESHVFRADKNNTVVASNTSIQVYGYQGSTQVATKVGTISGLPSDGMTATINNNSSTNTSITIAVTAALTSSVANSGTLTIPITVGNKTINKVFSWSKAQTGATGNNGNSSYIHLAYCNITKICNERQSFTLTEETLVRYGAENKWIYMTFPKGTYTADNTTFGKDPYPGKSKIVEKITDFSITDTTNRYYMGQYSDFVNNSSSDASKYTWTLTKGNTGAKGDTGATGKGVKSATTTYQAAATGTTIPTGTWSTSVPKTTAALPYLWSRTITTYTDNSTSTAYAVGSTPEGITVGGRNLLLNTRKFEGSNISTIATLDEKTYNDLFVRTYDNSASTSGYKDIISFLKIYPNKLGETYRLSFYAKGSGAQKLITYFHGVSGYLPVASVKTSAGYTGNSGDGSSSWTLTNEWKRYWVEWTLKSTGDLTKEKIVLFRLYYGGIASICGVKLEIGNKDTDWSPAPEDIENEILQRPTQGAVTDQISQSLKNATDSIDQTIAEKIGQSRTEIDTSTDKKIEAANKSVRQEIDSTTGEKIRDLEYFASQMTLKGNEFSIGIEKTKGVNLIKNSVMKQHKERGGSGANSKNIKANFWLNNSLSEDYFPNIIYGEDSLSRSNTDSGNYFRFNLVSSNNTQLDYIFSDPIDFKKNTSNIILSYKLRQMQKITNGVFFIGLVFYRQDTSTTGMGAVSKTAGIPTGYYVPITEYSNTNLTGSFSGDYIYKTMPITRQGNIKVEETVEVKETISNENVTERYVNLTYTPSSSNPTVNVLSYGSGAIEHFKATNKKVVLRLTDTRKVVTVQYTRDLQNFVAMDSPTDAKIKAALANIPVSEVTIYYNSSNKRIWTYNPFTGAFIETSNLYDTTVTDTNINTVRVVMGVRSTNSSAITGQIDISDIKLEYDSVSTIWTQNVGETYSKQYKMDEKGFSISSDTNTMFIDEDEIAAYKSNENGKLDMNNPVFQIKEDETILRQTTIYDQLNIENTNETRADAFVMKQQLIGGKWYFIFY